MGELKGMRRAMHKPAIYKSCLDRNDQRKAIIEDPLDWLATGYLKLRATS